MKRGPLDPGVFHDESPASCQPLGDGEYRLRLWVPRGVPLDRVEVFLDSRGDDPWVRMRRRRGRRLDRYEAVVRLPPGSATYRFRLQQAGARTFYDRGGVRPFVPDSGTAFRLQVGDEAPAWPRRQVFYQIFPDRFRRGRPEDPVPLHEGLGDQHQLARRWGTRPRRKVGHREIYGGDLDGVVAGLDYLQDLGVTALYFNPLFTSPSSHRYDTWDYDTIDPLLGGDAAYARMADALRERGMRWILDGVFNHTGDRHRWFSGPKGQRRPGFYTRSGGGWISWWGVDSLPKLDFANPEVVEAIYGGEDAVVPRWLRGPRGADGWRLDVAGCIGEGGGTEGNLRHLRGIRDASRRARPDAYVFGEYFDPAGACMEARALDGAMNYPGFGFPVAEWLSGKDFEGHARATQAQDVWAAWAAHRDARAGQDAQAAFNLLGSHDVPRLRTRLGGDARASRLAHVLLLTFPGAPCIYYGDEVGLEGGRDPDCRRTFPWDEGAWDQDLRGAVRALARWRPTSDVLCDGGLRLLRADGDLLAFARTLGEEVVLVLANRAGAPLRTRVDLGALGLSDERFEDVLSGRAVSLRRGVLTTRLGARGALVLREV